MAQTRLVVSESHDVTVVDFRDQIVLDSATALAIAAELYELIDTQRRRKVLLDMRAVRFLSSQMLGVLVTLHKKAGNIGGRVVLCGLVANLRQTVEMCGLAGVLPLAADMKAGLAMFSGGTASPPGQAAASPRGGGWQSVVQRQVRILFAGALVLVPMAITAWVIWSVGTWLDNLGQRACTNLGLKNAIPHGVGALVLIAAMYMVGLLTQLWLFRFLFGLLERLVTRVPGVKTVYESVRDLMKLFGGGNKQMGRVVKYSPPGSDATFLGILTNENPLGLEGDDPNRKVAVYMPLSYMIGGPTALVSPDHIVEVDMTVEQCMKFCATAHVSSHSHVKHPHAPVDAGNEANSHAGKETKGI
jgi:anti-anti-sigma factor